MKYESPTVQRGINMRQGHTQGRINVEKPKDRKKTFARLSRYFFGERLEVLILLVLVFVGVLGSVFAPKYQSSAIDCIVAGNFGGVSYFLAVMMGLYIVNGLATMLQGYLGAVLSQRMTGRIRDDLFKKIVLLPISYTDTHSHGDLISRITNDADNISNVISQSLSSMFSGVHGDFDALCNDAFDEVHAEILRSSSGIIGRTQRNNQRDDRQHPNCNGL